MSATWPQEPAGSSVLLDHNFSTALGSGMTDYYNSRSRPGALQADATAPVSASGCFVSYITAGSNTGGTELGWTSGGTVYDDMFVGMSWRTNAQFEGRPQGNKTFFMRGPGGDGLSNRTNGVFLFNNASLNNGSGVLIFAPNTGNLSNQQITGSTDPGVPIFPNVGNGTVTRGVWYKIQAYMKKSTNATSQDGILRWWINGVLVGNYTNVNYPGGFNEWLWSETWDGTPNFTVNVQWEHWLDHLYISTGGTVTPSPSAPTISSFTPTSGPVGTPITIVGANFDPSPAGNAITLNGTSCTTLGAQPTQLNTAVPNNGTTGQIRVTTSAGQALSSTNFTVTTPTPGGGGGGGTGGGAGATTSTFTTDFSGTQGPIWYYLNDDGSQMTYSNGLWSGNQLYKGIWSGGFHPGGTTGAALKYLAPGTGSVHITGTFADLDIGGGNGVTCTIKKNGSTATGGGPFSIANGNTTGSAYDISESVTEGDYFTFEVTSSGENSYDSTNLDPVVVYTPQSQTNETITLTLTNLTIQEFEIGVITLTIAPTRATESIITLSSSGAAAVVPVSISLAANAGSVNIPISAGPAGSAIVTATLGSSTTTSNITSTPTPPTPDPEDPAPASPTLSAYTDFLLAYRWF